MTVRPHRFRFTCALIGVIALICVVGLAVAQTPADPELSRGGGDPDASFVFQKRVDEVNLLFTVVDHRGRFISNLQLNDFEILDDRRAPEKIHSFQQESDLPLRVALVVDISGSVTPRFKYEQQAAIDFFKKILRPAVDRAMVVGFNEKVQLEQDLTNDVGVLRNAVLHLKPEGETALYDAIVYAAERLQKQSEKGTRKVIILISDGENNHSHAIMNDAQQAALRAEAPIYALSTNIQHEGDYSKGEAIMDLLSRYTGGEILPAREKENVVWAFRQVEQALRSQYVLSYKPADFSTDGRYREVKLSARKPKLKVESRHGYYAPRE